MTSQLWTKTPTGHDDFLIGGSGSSSINGGDGDDYILGDSVTPFTTGTNNSSTAPFNIDNAAMWTTGENPFFTDASIPHTSLYVSAVSGQEQYASVTINPGETITIDIDFGIHQVGGNVDTVIRLLDSGGTQVASDDDNANGFDPGSESTFDSYLTYTNTTGVLQTFTIVFTQFPGSPFSSGQDFVANISVTGHSATGSDGAGNDTLSGGDGNDTLAGLGGNDTLNGGPGDDDLYGGSGNDALNGGLGLDTAWYNDATSTVAVDLRLTGAQNTLGAGTDTLTNIENLVGSQFGDTLKGSSVDNSISGGDGSDIIYGYAGNDTLKGDNGNDYLNGGAGNDFLFADLTNFTSGYSNTLIGGDGDDVLHSSLGSDYLEGDDGNDTFTDTGGDDTIKGGSGVDLLDYSLNQSTGITVNLSLTSAQNTVGAGVDTITGIENLIGTHGNDTLTGNSSNNVIEGGQGDDTIDGAAGIDTASYEHVLSIGVQVDLNVTTAQFTQGAGTDTITNIENLIGSNFDDVLAGNSLNNRIDAGFGNDTLFGRGGNDSLHGGDGDDLLLGGAGNDKLDGGNGNDTASFADAGQGVIVNLATTGAQNTHQGSDTLTGIENITGSLFADTLHGDSGANILDGNSGNDTLTGGGGADIFRFSTFVGSVPNHDNITDFTQGTDLIELQRVTFGLSADGTMQASSFYAGTGAHDPDDRIIYDATTGNLYFDQDGNGQAAQILFAHVTPGTVLTNADFLVYG